MGVDRELRIAVVISVILLLIGVVSYAAFPSKAPDEPVRLAFHSSAGKVIFDHKTHTAPSGYGMSCMDCHHHPIDDESALRACGDCHGKSEEDESVRETCLECHDEADIEDTVFMKRSDAFHSQCIGCHEDYGAGAVECASCHVM